MYTVRQGILSWLFRRWPLQRSGWQSRRLHCQRMRRFYMFYLFSGLFNRCRCKTGISHAFCIRYRIPVCMHAARQPTGIWQARTVSRDQVLNWLTPPPDRLATPWH